MEINPDIYDLELKLKKNRKTARDSIDMLSTALIALQRGRGHVVEDHLERVIDDLKKML